MTYYTFARSELRSVELRDRCPACKKNQLDIIGHLRDDRYHNTIVRWFYECQWCGEEFYRDVMAGQLLRLP